MPSTSLTPEQMCQSCETKPARNHLCQIINGQKTTLDLCDECQRIHTGQSGITLPSLAGAMCFYCGDPPAMATMNQAWQFPSRQQRFHYACRRCFERCNRLTIEAIAHLPKDLVPEEQLNCLEQLVRDVDERVRLSVRDENK